MINISNEKAMKITKVIMALKWNSSVIVMLF